MDNLLGKRKSGDDETTAEGLADSLKQIKRRVELLETKFDETKDETPGFVFVPNKTLFVANLTDNIRISDIIDFFKGVGEVVRVRLIVTDKGKRVGCGFVEFASAREAKKALEENNGKYMKDRKIVLDVASKEATYRPPKYCLDHKVCYEEEGLPIEEEEDETSCVLFLANLSPQTSKISEIIDFLEDVGEVASVRLVVNHEGKHVGCGFVEFASENEAEEALKKKNGKYLHDHKILLTKRVHDETPDFVEAVGVRNKTLSFADFPDNFRISNIIRFFKDIGEVVHVRLTVDREGKHQSRALVEFASAKEAKKALEKKNGLYLNHRKISLDVVTTSKNQLPPKFCIDYKVWYEGYLRRQSLLVEEDAAMEEAAVREKTLFVSNLSPKTKISGITNFFKDVGEVVGVRLVVDERGMHVGCGFVEFASANEANKALEEKNYEYLHHCDIFLDVVEKAPYLFRHKYKLAEKLCYDYNLRVESLDLLTKPDSEEHNEIYDDW